MQLENTVVCCIISYYCLCGSRSFSDVPTLPLLFRATNSLCCEEYGRVKLLLITACFKSYRVQDWPASCFYPSCWHGAHRVENIKALFPPAARAARLAEKSTGDLKDWVNTLYSPNLHVLCAQSHTNQQGEAENKAGFKKIRFLTSNHFVPFTIEWMHLHFGPIRAAEQTPKERNQLKSWWPGPIPETRSCLIHDYEWRKKNYNPRQW